MRQSYARLNYFIPEDSEVLLLLILMDLFYRNDGLYSYVRGTELMSKSLKAIYYKAGALVIQT